MPKKRKPKPRPEIKIEFPAVGTRVMIVDGSEAYGDKGTIISVSDKNCLVETEDGCIWPVFEPWEVKVI